MKNNQPFMPQKKFTTKEQKDIQRKRQIQMKRKHKNDRLQARIQKLDKYYYDQQISVSNVALYLYFDMADAISNLYFKCNYPHYFYNAHKVLLLFMCVCNDCYVDDYYDMAYHSADYKDILDKPIPENNLNYPKDKILTLNHLRQYIVGEMNKLKEKNRIEAIQTLTDIDISNIINEKPDDTIIAQAKQNITNIIQNMSKEEFNRRMNKLVDRLQSHYLPTLYMWEKQVVDITKFLSQVYANNDVYQKVFKHASEQKQKIYDFYKSALNRNIKELKQYIE